MPWNVAVYDAAGIIRTSTVSIDTIPNLSVPLNTTLDMGQYINDPQGEVISSQILNLNTNYATYDSVTQLLTGVQITISPLPGLVLEVTTGAGDIQSNAFDLEVSSNLVQSIQSTPEQLALYFTASQYSSTAYALTEYKLSTSGTWLDAHPMYRIDPGGGNDAFGGIIFDLARGETYDVRVTVEDSGSTIYQNQFSTRALPAAAGPPDLTPSDLGTFEANINAASPGDVIELQDGIYQLSSPISITASGTASQPIYVRGESKAGTIIETNLNRGFNVTGQHIVMENMTIDGEYPADDNSSLKIAIVHSAGTATNEYLTVRDCIIRNFPTAIQTAGGSSGGYSNNCLIYNNTLTGTLSWSSLTLLSNYSWDNDGVRLVGHGNCVWNNTIQGYGDSITFAHGQDESLVRALECNYAYRNLIRNSCNDAFELDYSHRFIAVYDNYCENIDTCVSQSDNSSPQNYGPTYVFRNSFTNIAIKWFKSNANWEGWHWYNNTFAETAAIPGETNTDVADNGFFNDDSGARDRWVYRNNIHVCIDTSITYVWRQSWSTGTQSFDVSHNSWYPVDKRIDWWPSGAPGYLTLAAAQAGLETHNTLYPAGAGLSPNDRYHQNDVGTDSNPWANALGMGADALTELTAGITLELDSGSTAKNAGIAIPGITDDYSGAAPDLGAVIGGRDAVNYGNGVFAPAWVSALPLETWSAEGVNTLVSSGVRWSPGGLDWGTYGSSCCLVWAGSVMAPSLGAAGKQLFQGGGHGDGFDHAVYAWDIATRSWERMFDPSALCPTITSGGAAGDGIFSDGTPGCPHGWANHVWLPNDNRFYMGGRELNALGGNMVFAPTWYDFDTDSWTCLTDYVPDTAVGAQFNVTVYDSTRDQVWTVSGSSDQLTAARWTGSAWVSSNTGVTGRNVRIGDYCPDKDCIVLFSQTGNNCIVDCSSPSSAISLSLTGSGPTLGSQVIHDGLRWSTVLKAFLYFQEDNSGRIWKLTPPSGSITDPWEWSEISLNTAGFVTSTWASGATRPRNFAIMEYDDGTVLALQCMDHNDVHNTIRLA